MAWGCLNSWFGLAFGRAPLLGAAAAFLHGRGEGRPALPWIGAGVTLHAVSLVITMALNVPLNDRLTDAGDPARIRDPARVRARFESGWVHGNTARTVACTAALGCLAWAMRAARAARRR